MNYGKKEVIIALDDDNGSTKTISSSYREGAVIGNVRERYEIRHKVNSDLEEFAQFNAFYKEYTNDPSMLDVEFRVEGRNNTDGKRFTVNCYTRIVR